MWHLVAAAVWLLILAGWFALYGHALQPRDGTLEWIRMYDRQRFSCLADRGSLERRDIAWLLGCLMLTCAAWAWRLNAAQPLGACRPLDLALGLGMPALGAAGIYLLARMLQVNSLLAFLAALGTAVCFAMDSSAGPAILAVALFYGWMSQPVEAPFWKRMLWMLGAGVLVCGASILNPAAWWMLPVLGLVWLFVLALRWRAGDRVGRIVGAVLLSLLWLAALLLVFAVAWAMWHGGLGSRELPQAIWNGELLRALGAMRESLFRTPRVQLLWPLLENCGVVLAGLICWVTLLVFAIGRRSAAAAYLFAVTCGALAAYVLSGSYLLPVVFLADIAFAANQMWNRERRVIAVILPALTLVLEIGNQFFGA